MSIHGAIAVGVAALALALCATGARRYLSCRARRAGLYLAAMPVMLLNLVRLVGLVKVIAVTQSVTKVAKWLGAARTAKAVDGALDWISRPLWPKDILSRAPHPAAVSPSFRSPDAATAAGATPLACSSRRGKRASTS